MLIVLRSFETQQGSEMQGQMEPSEVGYVDLIVGGMECWGTEAFCLGPSVNLTSATFSREQLFTFDFLRRDEEKGAGYGVG